MPLKNVFFFLFSLFFVLQVFAEEISEVNSATPSNLGSESLDANDTPPSSLGSESLEANKVDSNKALTSDKPQPFESVHRFPLYVGTTGVGLGYIWGFSSNFSVGMGYSMLSFDGELELDDIDYQFDLNLGLLQLILDYRPFSGVFRLRTGVVYNQNEVDLGLAPLDKSITINDTEYTLEQVAALDGELSFGRWGGYLGFGLDIPGGSSRGLTFDIGVFSHNPHFVISVQCGESLGEALCDTLRDDSLDEERSVQDEVSKFKLFPVLQLGIRL